VFCKIIIAASDEARLILSCIMKYILTLVLACLMFVACKAQQENWDVYLAQYDEGVGSTTLNMDLIHYAPIKALPYLIKVSIIVNNCPNDGLPEAKELGKLHVMSDDIIKLISTSTVQNQFTGTFTYQCEKMNYIYASDTLHVRDKLMKLLQDKYAAYEYYISIKPDIKWEAYTTFLYPNEITQEFMANEKVIEQLEAAGDDNSKSRPIDHWFYFSSDKDRKTFIESLKTQGFKVEATEQVNGPAPFQLHVSKPGNINIRELSDLTLELRKKAKEYHGEYDGWECVVIKK
jgi:uncharacterized protein (TIGR01619 family)